MLLSAGRDNYDVSSREGRGSAVTGNSFPRTSASLLGSGFGVMGPPFGVTVWVIRVGVRIVVRIWGYSYTHSLISAET